MAEISQQTIHEKQALNEFLTFVSKTSKATGLLRKSSGVVNPNNIISQHNTKNPSKARIPFWVWRKLKKRAGKWKRERRKEEGGERGEIEVAILQDYMSSIVCVNLAGERYLKGDVLFGDNFGQLWRKW
ncbi:hypothetical protein HAX54_028365 [Datura stramonium]|uniref:Uncharacterized protein n=1 Tax=Datura stramonium TaxID=4076 RepID=A0ABS8V4A1_DATST|nr:hypothetical protein [Datura stramonium]